MFRELFLLSALAASFSACGTPPPEPWLRYELDGMTEMKPRGPGKYGASLCGADVLVDLRDPKTNVLVVVENPSDASVTVKVGPDAGAPRAAIGEVLLRRIDGSGLGGPDMMAYAGMQPLAVDGGWRATFFLDAPLGREAKLGQYLVLAIEGEDQGGERARFLVPMIAKMGGTKPRTGN